VSAVAPPTHPEGIGKTHFGKTFLVLLALGLPGILSLIPTIISQLGALPSELADMGMPVVVALALLNPLILLALGVTMGTLLAHRVGLRSLVAEKVRQGAAIWPQLRPHIAMAFVAGLIFAVVVLGLDALINPFAGTALENASAAGESPTIGALLTQPAAGVGLDGHRPVGAAVRGRSPAGHGVHGRTDPADHLPHCSAECAGRVALWLALLAA